MRIIGVIDIADGRAVHARAGDRRRYRPVSTADGRRVAGDAARLARIYTDVLGLTELYVADLDAIGCPTGPGRALPGGLVAPGVGVWLDAGISSLGRALEAASQGASQIVVGLETLPSWAVFEDICRILGGDRVAFSLDLRDGQPVFPTMAARLGRREPEVLARRAREAGAGSVIVLDLARVGTGSGPDPLLLSRIRAAVGGATLVTGGGIRGPDDLDTLAALGCDGALIASAFHNGRLRRGDVAARTG